MKKEVKTDLTTLRKQLTFLKIGQWNDIGKRVTSGHAEMDDKEWQNVQVSISCCKKKTELFS